MFYFSDFHNTGETHKCHSQKTGSNQSNRSSLHSFRDIYQTHLFAQTRKKSQRQAKTDSCGKCINHTGQQIIIFLNYKDGNTKNTTVSCDQRQKTHPVPDTKKAILFSK